MLKCSSAVSADGPPALSPHLPQCRAFATGDRDVPLTSDDLHSVFVPNHVVEPEMLVGLSSDVDGIGVADLLFSEL